MISPHVHSCLSEVVAHPKTYSIHESFDFGREATQFREQAWKLKGAILPEVATRRGHAESIQHNQVFKEYTTGASGHEVT